MLLAGNRECEKQSMYCWMFYILIWVHSVIVCVYTHLMYKYIQNVYTLTYALCINVFIIFTWIVYILFKKINYKTNSYFKSLFIWWCVVNVIVVKLCILQSLIQSSTIFALVFRHWPLPLTFRCFRLQRFPWLPL